MKQQAGFYGWKLLAAAWFITAIGTGFTYYGGNIMNSHMAREMGLDRKSLGLAFGTFGMCMGLVVPLVGMWVNTWGPRKILMAGTLLTGLGALAMALVVDSMTGVLVAYGLVMGVGASLGGLLPAQTLIAHWFRRRLAMALTIMLTGTVTGGFVAAPLFDGIITAYDGNWRAGWVAMAIGCGICFTIVLAFVRNLPADLGQVPDGVAEALPGSSGEAALPGEAGVYKTTDDWSFREALGHPAWWLLALGTVCFLSTFGMMVGHGVVHFKDLGHTSANATLFLALLPLTGLAGKAVVATLGDRVEPRFLWAGAMVLMALGMALGVTATSAMALYAAAFLLGAGNAAAYPCMITLVANYFGRAAYASLMGVMLLIGALATAVGPLLAGVVFDRFGDYTLAFYPAALLCLLGAVLMPFVRPPRPVAARLKPYPAG